MTYPKILVIAFLTTAASFGDTIVMKNGERQEGRVVREDAENYYVEVHFSKTIKEERAIPKADVESILKVSEDAIAFEEVAGLVPTPELLPVEGYGSRIELVMDFIKKYPASGKLGEAKRILEKLQSEQNIVIAGGVKYGEMMVSAADYNANAYFYDVTLAEKVIKRAVGKGEVLVGLRKFSEYEERFGLGAADPEFLQLMKKVLGLHARNLEANIETFDKRMEKREMELMMMGTETRADSKRALMELDQSIAARLQSEQDSDTTWVTPDINNEESLKDSLKQAGKTMKMLERPKKKGSKNSTGVDTAEAYRLAWGKLTAGSEDEKKEVMEMAKDNGLPEFYLEKLAKHGDMDAE